MVVTGPLDPGPVVTGSVISASAFEKGGTLALGSFKAGPGAEADDETDQLSRTMIKGIKDTLPEDHTRFVLQTNDPKASDFFLDGYIEDYGRKGHLAHLSVDGEIWLRETGEKILSFQTSVVIDFKTRDPGSAAYQIGAAIAKYIGSKL